MKLMPYERWMATAVARRQAEVRSDRVQRIEANYGSDGVALLAAGMATVVLGELIGLLGLAFLAVAASVSVVIIAFGAALIAFSLVRFVAAHRAGREFRTG